MCFKPYTEKIKKKIGICSIWGRIRIHNPGSRSADPDPDQNDTDPKHWFCRQKLDPCDQSSSSTWFLNLALVLVLFPFSLLLWGVYISDEIHNYPPPPTHPFSEKYFCPKYTLPFSPCLFHFFPTFFNFPFRPLCYPLCSYFPPNNPINQFSKPEKYTPLVYTSF